MAQESSEPVRGFWCDVCLKDVYATIFIKQSNSAAAWWLHRHYCKVARGVLELIRYADNPKADPYFHRSRDVRRFALEHEQDLIQPGDPRFAKAYPKEYAEMQAAQERYNKRLKDEEEKEWREDKDLIEQFGPSARDALKIAKEHMEAV